MISKIFHLPLILVSLYISVRRCPFKTNKERRHLFWILLKLNFLKSSKPKGEFVRFRILDYDIYAYDYISLLNLVNEIFINGEYLFESETASPKILDCGANIGMAALFFKKLFPGAEIVCFEPNPLSYKLLEMNVRGNDLQHVTIINKAVADEVGKLDFFIGNEKGSVIASLSEDRNNTSRISVDAIRLSEFIGERKFDLAKIDVEGAEHAVINDLILDNKINSIGEFMIEYHHMVDKKNTRLAEFLEKMERSGFLYNVRAKYRRIGNYQDIFFHFYN
jgi:FkbM family methyltransferase